MNAKTIIILLSLITSLATLRAIADQNIPLDNNSKWLPPIANKETNPAFYPHRANTRTGTLLDHKEFEPAATCGSCHQEIYQQWQQSIMAKSWEDPIYRALLAKASAATNGKVDKFCTGCHSPIGLTTGTIQNVTHQKSDPKSDNLAPGVDCESCHNITGRTGLDNGAYILEPNSKNGLPTKLGPRKDAVSPYHETEYSELHTRSDFCAVCHNVTHPFSHTPIERTYDEWLESNYSTNDTQCQDCHMPSYRGKAAVMGPVREDVASHYFAGANTTLHKYFGDYEAALRAEKMLKSAGTVEITEIKNLVPGGVATISVKAENKNTGHKLPTGFPEGREVWIDFSVTDSNKKTLYRLGKIKDGKTEPGTKNFKVWLGDKDGNVLDIEVWQVEKVLKDNRLLPGGFEELSYSFLVPPQAKLPLQISATMKYWNFPQKLVDELLGEGEITVDIVDIDHAQITLNDWQQTAFAVK